MAPPSQLFFLPGASDNMGFWRPVADKLKHAGEPVFFGWPVLILLQPSLPSRWEELWRYKPHYNDNTLNTDGHIRCS